jgi:hypothetical protein
LTGDCPLKTTPPSCSALAMSAVPSWRFRIVRSCRAASPMLRLRNAGSSVDALLDASQLQCPPLTPP